jgi:uroporphyrinogen-III synthase
VTGHKEKSLAGVRVLVTRPAEQAHNLVQLIEAAGGIAIRFPTIKIEEPSNRSALIKQIDELGRADIAIFVSANAVNKAMPLIASRYSPFPQQLQFACVGQGTAVALERLGVRATLVPHERFDSDGLLDLPVLQDVRNKRIIIFRGEGGRELLAQTLRSRGADVQYAECYRRALPGNDVAPLLQRWAHGEIDVVTATSVGALKNLFAIVGEAGHAPLLQTPIVVISQRVAATCRQFGFVHGPYVASTASDEGMLDAIKAWRASEKPV